MTGQRIGYRRVSTLDQNAERQLDGMEFDVLFTDHASGKDTRRPELNTMLTHARKGDTIFVHSLDRLARNLDDLRRLVSTLVERGVILHFVKESLIFSGEENAIANLLLSVMGAFAEFERSLIRERQREGIALAKHRGIYKGRAPKIDPTYRMEIYDRARAGESKAELAKEFQVNRVTIYKIIKEQSQAA